MPRYVALTPIKAGKKGDGITQPGESIEMDAASAKPLLAAGSIVTPADARKLQESGAPGDSAAMHNRIAELEAERDGLRETVAALEKQVSDLTAAADDKVGGKSGGDPKLPGT